MSQITDGQLHQFTNGETVTDSGTAGINTFLNIIKAAHNDTDTKITQIVNTLSGQVNGASINKKIGEVFGASQGQTVFTLTKGTYVTGNHMLDVYVNGTRKSVDNADFTETSSSSFTLATPLNLNDKVEVEYWQGVSVSPPTGVALHASTHVKGGTDPIDMMQLTNYDNFFILHMMGAI